MNLAWDEKAILGGQMPDVQKKSLDAPDQTFHLEKMDLDYVQLGDLTVGRGVSYPGWRWSDHVRPQVGGDLCEVRHVGVVLSGSFEVVMRDGTRYLFGPNDIFDIPPGHDGYTVGDEPCVQIGWAGVRTFAPAELIGAANTSLATLMMTDIVESTKLASELGDAAWTELLSRHFESARVALDRHGGREVSTTGDGILATFDGPAAAVRCAASIRRLASDERLHIRAGVHIGEVQGIAGDVRGIAVHEVARIADAAEPDEILVSSVTKALAGSSGLQFDDVGPHRLKGLPDEVILYAYVE